MDYGSVLSAAGQSGNGDMEILTKGSVYYVKWPLLSSAVKAKTPWVSFDITKLDEISGIDTSSLRSVNQGDPSQTLVYLKAAGTVEDQGTEDVDGDLDNEVPRGHRPEQDSEPRAGRPA